MTKCTLSDNELISESFKWIKKLADTGGTAWTLKVPVDFNNDPDILFCELGNRLKDKDQQLSEEREKAGKLVEALKMCLYALCNNKDERRIYNKAYKSLTEYINQGHTNP